MSRYIYFPEDFSFDLKPICGNKSMGLWEMTRLGFRVPKFFTISSEVCIYYHKHKSLPEDFETKLLEAINRLQNESKKQLGAGLCVAARSGSMFSMPGMMDTILNIDNIQNLKAAIIAVIKSYMSERAVLYRKVNRIPDSCGTSVTIQEMVYGNINGMTGVMFSRNPSNGAKELYGEFLINAQGEDLVSGLKTPLLLTKESVDAIFPKMYEELTEVAAKLEKYYRDAQDIEFTVENGTLFILQTRSAKRTISANIKITYDMLTENLINEHEAINRLNPDELDQILHPQIKYTDNVKVIGQGLPASPGSATGIAVFSSEDAVELSKTDDVILVRNYTSPDDIDGIFAAKGLLTVTGGMTSHAAVITRGIGKPCICGTQNAVISGNNEFFSINGYKIEKGNLITIDGSNGNIILGNAELTEAGVPEELNQLLKVAQQLSGIQVRANADDRQEAELSLKFGAQGIGLCRTEHMMFEPTKLSLFRRYICIEDKERRTQILEELKKAYIKDFSDIFETLNGFPINIRLLDPPLHEFLSISEETNIQVLADSIGLDVKTLKTKLLSIKEENPMLGHRGCRLGITNPEIYAMQIESIFSAAENSNPLGFPIEITVPFVSTIEEIEMLLNLINNEAQKFSKVKYSIGVMIELPRAVFIADKLASICDFFSFGTNDLTQTTYGISRDDMSSFIYEYKSKGILTDDPFVTLDVEGVGALIKLAIEKGRRVNPNLKIGVCGEHGGDYKSIQFFKSIDVDYVSCSPYRIQAAIISSAKTTL